MDIYFFGNLCETVVGSGSELLGPKKWPLALRLQLFAKHYALRVKHPFMAINKARAKRRTTRRVY